MNNYVEVLKTCSKCRSEKSLNEFCFSKNGKFNRQVSCKSCNKEYREQNKEKNKKYLRKYYEENKLKLNIQNSKRAKNNFEKVAKYKKQWYEANKKKILEKSKSRAIIKKYEIKEYKRDYYIKNKSTILNKLQKNKKDRKARDPIFALKCKISDVIRQSLKKCKNKRNVTILSCTIEEFKQHIESQFLPWMTWDNYGNCPTLEYNCSWHFDHIIPTRLGKTVEDLYLLNHWSNFQPLCSKVNQSDKGGIYYPVCNLVVRELDKFNNGL